MKYLIHSGLIKDLSWPRAIIAHICDTILDKFYETDEDWFSNWIARIWFWAVNVNDK